MPHKVRRRDLELLRKELTANSEAATIAKSGGANRASYKRFPQIRKRETPSGTRAGAALYVRAIRKDKTRRREDDQRATARRS